jgi:hypothetical protein
LIESTLDDIANRARSQRKARRRFDAPRRRPTTQLRIAAQPGHALRRRAHDHKIRIEPYMSASSFRYDAFVCCTKFDAMRNVCRGLSVT